MNISCAGIIVGNIICSLLYTILISILNILSSKLAKKYRITVRQLTINLEPARHVGDRMYRGETFVMQMDAHCLFINHWDTKITTQWAQTGNEMAVLRYLASLFAPSFITVFIGL